MSQSLRVVALCPDNAHYLRQLPELFMRAYGKDYVTPDVYELQFWKTHIGQRFISLGVAVDKELIAHLSIGHDFSNEGEVALSHFALDPEASDDHAAVGSLLANAVFSQTHRSGRGFLYSLVPTDDTKLLDVLSPLLNLTPVAFCPGYFPGNSGVKRRDAWVALSLIECESNPADIFLPDNSVNVCGELLNRLGTTRSVHSQNRPHPSLTSVNGSSQKREGVGLQQAFFQRQGVRLSFLVPSLLADNALPLESEPAGSSPVAADFLLIDCRDPQAPRLCESLELNGYHFAGFFPRLKNSDYLVFSAQPIPREKLVELGEIAETDPASPIGVDEGSMPAAFTETAEVF